jgi:hypothetical protein
MNPAFQDPRFQRSAFRSKALGAGLIIGLAVAAVAVVGPVLWEDQKIKSDVAGQNVRAIEEGINQAQTIRNNRKQ